MKTISNTLKNLNVMIIEEDNMLSCEIKYMLKKMGFYDNKIYKAPCLSSFRALIRTHHFHLIICRYYSKHSAICQNYLNLYQQCSLYLRECSVIFVTEKLTTKEENDINQFKIDNYLEIPFNHNQFSRLISDSLIKRKILAVVYDLIEKENFSEVFNMCDLLKKKKNSWKNEIFKATIDHYITCKQYNAAINLLNDLRSKEQNEWLYIKLIEINSMLGEYDQALEIAHEFEALGFPEHPLISEITAQQSILDSDIPSAIEVIEKVVTRYPNLTSTMINLAYLYILSGEHHKGLFIFNSINQDHIISDEQYLCIEESKLYLEVRLNILNKNIHNPPIISPRLDDLLIYSGEDKKSSKDFYDIIQRINNQNPICPEKRLAIIWENTKFLHRKIILIGIAYFLGHLDLLTHWLDDEIGKISVIKNIDDAVRSLIFNTISQLTQDKQKVIETAEEMKQKGKHLESFVILSREAPSSIVHHIQLVNSISKEDTITLSVENESMDMDNVLFQFKYSIAILMKSLLRHDPNHPKLENLIKINEIVTSRFKLSKDSHSA